MYETLIYQAYPLAKRALTLIALKNCIVILIYCIMEKKPRLFHLILQPPIEARKQHVTIASQRPVYAS